MNNPSYFAQKLGKLIYYSLAAAVLSACASAPSTPTTTLKKQSHLESIGWSTLGLGPEDDHPSVNQTLPRPTDPEYQAQYDLLHDPRTQHELDRIEALPNASIDCTLFQFPETDHNRIVVTYRIFQGNCVDGYLEGMAIVKAEGVFREGPTDSVGATWYIGEFSKGKRHGTFVGRSRSNTQYSEEAYYDSNTIRTDFSKFFVEGLIEGKSVTIRYWNDESAPRTKEMILGTAQRGQSHGESTVYLGNKIRSRFTWKNGTPWTAANYDEQGRETIGWIDGKFYMNLAEERARRIQAKRQQEQAAREAQARQSQSSGKRKKSIFGSLLTGVTVGVLGSAGGMSAEQAIELGGAAAADAAGNTGGSNIRQTQQNTSGQSTTNSASNNNKQTRTYSHSFSCPASGRKTVDIPYKSQRCLIALKQFAEVMSCNIASEMQQARNDCIARCGRADCYEE